MSIDLPAAPTFGSAINQRPAPEVLQHGRDAALGDGFPADIAMDSLAGVDFAKGCYVGQEVVSRMEHRTTPRNRLVEVIFPGPAVAGAEIVAAYHAMHKE